LMMSPIFKPKTLVATVIRMSLSLSEMK